MAEETFRILSETEPLSRKMLEDYDKVYLPLDMNNLSRAEQFFDDIENLGRFNTTKVIKSKAGYLVEFSRN